MATHRALKRNCMERRIDRAESQPLYVTDIDTDCGEIRISGLTNSYRIRLDRRRQRHTCTCPDFTKRREMCKHLAYVYLRVCKLSRREVVRAQGFPLVCDLSVRCTSSRPSELTETECPICFDSFGVGDGESRYRPFAQCQFCKKPFHEDCIQVWKRVHNTCPMCRKIWNVEKRPVYGNHG